MAYIAKLTNAGGVSTVTRYVDMLAGNAAFVDGYYESIATTTVGAGGSASITFSGIPSTYQHLQIRSLQKMTTDIRWTWLQFNGDTGASQYSYHSLHGSGSAAAATGGGFATSYARTGLLGTQFGGAVIDILDYANTSKLKVVRSLWGYDNNGSGYVGLNSNAWNSTAAITSITISCEGSDIYTQNSQFALYGIKG